MNTHLRNSLFLASTLFVSEAVSAACNDLVITTENMTEFRIVSTDNVQAQHTEYSSTGTRSTLQRRSFWNWGGIVRPLTAVLHIKKEGSDHKVTVTQEYCLRTSGAINVSVESDRPVLSYESFPAPSFPKGPGRVVFK